MDGIRESTLCVVIAIADIAGWGAPCLLLIERPIKSLDRQ
jgi:hypothetical protein